MRPILFVALICLLPLFSMGQSMEDKTVNEPSGKRKKWMVTALAVQQTASLYVEYKWWWEHNYHPFQVENDGGFNNYSLGIDKAGHFYTSYLYSNLLYETMKWGDFSEKSARTWSTVLPFVWALSIEIGDGFSSFAFSPDDLLANSLGIACSFLQKTYPSLQKIKFKYSYFPSSYHINNNFKTWSLTGDYNGHIYWISADVHELLPASMKKVWPKYLNLAFGYGVDNFTETDHKLSGFPLKREFCIGFDYNLSRINIKNRTASTLLRMADFIHLPAPGMKKTDSESWEGKILLLN